MRTTPPLLGASSSCYAGKCDLPIDTILRLFIILFFIISLTFGVGSNFFYPEKSVLPGLALATNVCMRPTSPFFLQLEQI